MTMKNAKTTTILSGLLAVVSLISLGAMPDGDAAKDDDQLRVEKKILDIEKNENTFHKLAQAAFEREDEIAYREYLIHSDSVSEPEKLVSMARILQLQGELVPIYEEMERIQEVHYQLYEVPEGKFSKLSDVHSELKLDFDQRGDDKPIVDFYIDQKTEKLVFINKDSDSGLSDSDKAKIQEKSGELEYKIEEVDKAKHSRCLARSNNCNPMMGGLKVQYDGGHGTLGFPATRDGDTGFVITAHQVRDETGGTVYQSTATAGTVEAVSPNNCDCAFVDHYSTKSTDGKVWISSYGRFAITSESDGWSDHDVGTLLRKSGVTTGVTSGSITSSAGNYVYTTIHTQKGDSGSPVYAGSGTSGMLYGLLWGFVQGTNHGIYTPYHVVESHLGLD